MDNANTGKRAGQTTLDLGGGGGGPSPEADPEALLEGLNPPQRDAVLANEGPVLILAGAGSGKTRAITHKIAYLVRHEGYRPWEILAVTFTNKAAREMRERTEQLLGESAEGLWMGTFHSVGNRILRRHGELLGLPRSFVIYDSDDQKALVRRCLAALNLDEKMHAPKQVQNFINQQKQECRPPDHPDVPRHNLQQERFQKVYELYQRAILEAGAVDFADLIWLPLRLMQEFPLVASEFRQRWQFVVVDEFQDTNHAQYALLKAVLNDGQRLCVVGDDDQSIYRWRGADVGNILQFDQDFPGTTVVRLEQNYRSSGNILEGAAALIAENHTRHGKTLWTERGPGAKISIFEADSDRREAEYVAKRILALREDHPYREMAVFYRTNSQSRALEDTFIREGVPHQIIGGLRFYERMEVKDILAYLKLVVNPRDVVSFERIVNTPPRGIGKTTQQAIRDYADSEGTTLFEAARRLAAGGKKGLAKKLTPFVALMERVQRMAETEPALAIVAHIIEEIGYIERLEASSDPAAEGRIENITELQNAIDEFGDLTGDRRLAAYLDQVALVADIDRADLNQDAVSLMTAHTAKGLEFDVVFVTGMEEGLLPHFNSAQSEEGIEEERRLAYVAMTRARHHLHLTHAMTRRRFGDIKASAPSHFLQSLPPGVVERSGNLRRSFSSGPPGRRGRRDPFEREPSPTRRRPSTWDDYDQSAPSYDEFSQDEVVLRPGVVVFHPKYGQGMIKAISGNGPKAHVHVDFGPVHGTRRIIARFLTLDS